MADLVWREHPHAGRFAGAVAAEVTDAIARVMQPGRRVLAAFPGGATPAPVFAMLPREPWAWDRVTILPTDERDVAEDHPLSNIGALRRALGNLGADLRPLAAAEALPFPLDLAWLGMGEDGHVASLFPGPDLEAAFATDARLVRVRPDPLPEGAPVTRTSLSARALADARVLLLAIRGAAKRAVLEEAAATATRPVGRLFAMVSGPVLVHWCP